MSLPTNLAAFLTIGGLATLGTPPAQNASLAISSTFAHFDSRPEAGSVYASISSNQGPSNEANGYLSAFQKNLDGVGQHWLHGLTDAREIEDWLRDGADMAISTRCAWWLAASILIITQEWPKYMVMCLDEGVKLYMAMAKYLRGYARGIEDMHAENWPVWH